MARFIQAKTILNKTKRRDPWFLDDYTINPYSSCSFNCLYCYIRGSKYGFNMEERLSVKENAAALLKKQLAAKAKKGQYGFIVVSSATDPYLQLEKEQQLTRALLEVIASYLFPVHIITKSDLVERDFDILQYIGTNAHLPQGLQGEVPSGALLTFSFSTTDDPTAKIFEPGATPPSKRLLALENAAMQGFHTGVSLMPLLPFISDTSESLSRMFHQFRKAGAKYVLPATLGLHGTEQDSGRMLILRAIRKHYPQLEHKYQKWFGEASEMPEYYRQAFYKKMQALEAEFGIPGKITH